MAETKRGFGGVLRWRGLLGELSNKRRIGLFLCLLLISASMTFLQFGFVGIGASGQYVAYVIALLAPVTASALLLGMGWGALEGACSGAVLWAHACWQPLDIVECYFVTPVSSILLYGVAGLFLGLLLSIALRNDPKGPRRFVYMGIVCLIVALFSSVAFEVTMAYQMTMLESLESVMALIGTGMIEIQILCDFLLMLAVCIIASRVVEWYWTTQLYVGVRTIFRARLLAALFIVFLLLSSCGFVGITIIQSGNANDGIRDELSYLNTQISKRFDDFEKIKDLDFDAPDDVIDKLTTYIVSSLNPGTLLDGYSETDGTVVVFINDEVRYTYSDAFKKGDTFTSIYGEENKAMVKNLAKSNEMQLVLYDAGDDRYELGYARAIEPMDDVYILMQQPFSMVFEHRSGTMLWTAILVFALLVVVYVVTAQLLRRVVIEPVNNTNEALGKITHGNLDEIVKEVGSIEFSTLSLGINTTVDSLKTLIDEAERRNEQDLATAKAIQEGALPRTFPAFPNVDCVDLFASMDAAKEVGGDFYDFFEVDEHTVGFLIADVSGKGIPGALFMMAAKAEIQNYLSTGMEPAQAIAAANAYLCANNEAGMFVTVWAATLDWTSGELTYVNAGHNFPLLRHGRGGSWEWLKKKCGLFLGTFDIAKYRQESIVLEPGDELILYTDGVNEAFSVDEQEYGNDRLDAFLAAHNDMRPEELVRALRADVASWAEGAEQSDDVTIVVMEYALEK